MLLTGNLLAIGRSQSLLWHSSLGLGTMSAMTIILTLAINAIIWFVAVPTLQFIRRLFTRHRVHGNSLAR